MRTFRVFKELFKFAQKYLKSAKLYHFFEFCANFKIIYKTTFFDVNFWFNFINKIIPEGGKMNSVKEWGDRDDVEFG